MTKTFTHGTIYAWMKRKCSCEICYEAKIAWHDARNKVRRGGSSPRGPYQKPVHGTNSMYRNGCRCSLCGEAHRIEAQEYKESIKR